MPADSGADPDKVLSSGCGSITTEDDGVVFSASVELSAFEGDAESLFKGFASLLPLLRDVGVSVRGGAILLGGFDVSSAGNASFCLPGLTAGSGSAAT